jgi:hypothetical protein
MTLIPPLSLSLSRARIQHPSKFQNHLRFTILCVTWFCSRVSTVKQDSAHHTTRPVSHFLPCCYAFKLYVLSLWLARGVWNKSVSSLTRWETLSLHSCTKIDTVKAMLHLPYTTGTRQNALYKSDRSHHKYTNINYRATSRCTRRRSVEKVMLI